MATHTLVRSEKIQRTFSKTVPFIPRYTMLGGSEVSTASGSADLFRHLPIKAYAPDAAFRVFEFSSDLLPSSGSIAHRTTVNPDVRVTATRKNTFTADRHHGLETFLMSTTTVQPLSKVGGLGSNVPTCRPNTARPSHYSWYSVGGGASVNGCHGHLPPQDVRLMQGARAASSVKELSISTPCVPPSLCRPETYLGIADYGTGRISTSSCVLDQLTPQGRSSVMITAPELYTLPQCSIVCKDVSDSDVSNNGSCADFNSAQSYGHCAGHRHSSRSDVETLNVSQRSTDSLSSSSGQRDSSEDVTM